MKNKIVDLHIDLASCVKNGSTSQVSLASLRAVSKIFLGSVFIEPGDTPLPNGELNKRVIEDICWYRDLEINGSPEPISVIKDAGGFKRVIEKEKLGVIIHIEGADALAPDTEKYLALWHALGLRSLGLVWNHDNALGVSAASNRSAEGLTPFGKAMARRLNDLGIMIDCSHLNRAGFYDVLKLASSPPIVTHGNAAAICPSPRNFSDEQIRDLASAGGIIGVFFSGKYVAGNGKPTMQDAVRHIRHIADVGGIDAVAIGSDFGGITTGLVSGLASLGDMGNLEQALLEDGFSPEEARKIFFGNAIRYLERFFSYQS